MLAILLTTSWGEEIIEGPHEPLVSLEDFQKINGILSKSHNRGYEQKFGLEIKDNMLKLWQLGSLSQKKRVQAMIFPDGLVYDKKNDDIEPLSKNEFMFVFDLKSVGYEEKEKGQTLNFEDLSSVAPAGVELLNLWNDFRKVVIFIDENPWVKPMLEKIEKHKK